MIKLVALDLDHTLLGKDSTISYKIKRLYVIEQGKSQISKAGCIILLDALPENLSLQAP